MKNRRETGFYEYTEILDRTTRRPALVEEKRIEYSGDTKLSNPEAIVDMMNEVYGMDQLAQEKLFVLAVDLQLRIKGLFLISKGTANKAFSSHAEIFTKAMLVGAYGIILIHNHPGGRSEASQEDKEVAAKLAAYGRDLGVALLDSIVIGDREYFSMKMTEPEILNTKIRYE